MSRVLVAGGAGRIGAAVVRRLLADPAYEVRVADRRAAPLWMREACAVHTADLRDATSAQDALADCTHVINLAAIRPGDRNACAQAAPHTIIEANIAITAALLRAAIDQGVERFVHVSSPAVFERASVFPTPEEHLLDCPAPSSAYGISQLAGEFYCRAAGAEHGVPYTICRPFGTYGPDRASRPGDAAATNGDSPANAEDWISATIAAVIAGQAPVRVPASGEHTQTLTYVDDIAEGLLAAMRSPAATDETFNLSAPNELSTEEIVGAVWAACGRNPHALTVELLPAAPHTPARQWPSVAKAEDLLGWHATTPLSQGLQRTVTALSALTPATAPA